MFDIVIPVLNEEKILVEKKKYYQWLKTQGHVIFVDGGSSDQTKTIAQEFGEVCSAEKGRAIQMNRGVDSAKSDHLLFLHVDTFISPEGILELKNAAAKNVAAACFVLAIDDPRFVFRVFEGVVNFMARFFGVVDGDLGLLIQRKVFQELKGFDQVPVMEDILFSEKLKTRYKVQILPAHIMASSRVWYKEGFWKTLKRYTESYLQLARRDISIPPLNNGGQR